MISQPAIRDVPEGVPAFAELDSGGPHRPAAGYLAGCPAARTSLRLGLVRFVCERQPPSTDQRDTGFPRIVKGTVDIGAFESSGGTQAASVYVNAAWASDPVGTAVTWTDGTAHTVGVDAFGTIQAAVYVVAANGTVNVAAGRTARRSTSPKA